MPMTARDETTKQFHDELGKLIRKHCLISMQVNNSD